MRFTISLSLLFAALTVAACGGSASPNTGGATSAQGAASAKKAAGLAFASCMRSHGVPNFPDPSSGGGGPRLQVQSGSSGTSVNGVAVNSHAFQSAMQLCRSYLPNGGHPTAAQTAQAKAQALAMSRCMRSHGVPNFPDPQFRTGPGGGIGVQVNGAGINPNSPAFQAAQRACGTLFGKAAVVTKGPSG